MIHPCQLARAGVELRRLALAHAGTVLGRGLVGLMFEIACVPTQPKQLPAVQVSPLQPAGPPRNTTST